MTHSETTKIIDITNKPKYKRLLIGCIFHVRKQASLRVLCERHDGRVAYLNAAVSKGYHMEVLFKGKDPVGMIEYGPPEAAGLPVSGKNIIVMNCIWVHRRAQGRKYGKLLIEEMIDSESHAAGFATIALEDYWMHWMQKWMMEKLGFRSVRSLRLKHRKYKKDRCFVLHLMWLPRSGRSTLPTWNEVELLHGVDFCPSHPLYWGKYGCVKSGLRQVHERC